MKHFLSYIYASNLSLIKTGLCYLKMIFEKSNNRFEKSFYLLVQSGYISIYDYEEFDMTSELLIFCDEKIYKNFLKLAKESNNEDVRQSCEEDLKNDCSAYKKNRWYIILCEEYAEFKKKLCVNNSLF